MAGICGRRWFMRSMNISLWSMARSGALRPCPKGLRGDPPNRHGRFPARVASPATEPRLEIEHGGIRRQAQPVKQRAWRDQYVVAAGEALDPHEVSRPSILDPIGAE